MNINITRLSRLAVIHVLLVLYYATTYPDRHAHEMAHELSLVYVMVGMINNLTAELAMIKYARLVQTQEQSF